MSNNVRKSQVLSLEDLFVSVTLAVGQSIAWVGDRLGNSVSGVGADVGQHACSFDKWSKRAIICIGTIITRWSEFCTEPTARVATEMITLERFPLEWRVCVAVQTCQVSET